MANRYRIKEYDLVNDIYILQKRFLFVFWISISAGPKEKTTEICRRENLNHQSKQRNKAVQRKRQKKLS